MHFVNDVAVLCLTWLLIVITVGVTVMLLAMFTKAVRDVRGRVRRASGTPEDQERP